MGQLTHKAKVLIIEEQALKYLADDLKIQIPSSAIFLTGSRGIGIETNKSDYDFGIGLELATQIKEALSVRDLKCNESNYFSGFKCLGPNGEEYNFVPLGEKDFVAWKQTTECLQAVSKELYGMDRFDRHSIFQATVANMRLMNVLTNAHSVTCGVVTSTRIPNIGDF